MGSVKMLRPAVATDLLRRSTERILGLPWWALWILFMMILLLRRPQAILHADFWGEDGCLWYAGAYDLGWRSLLSPLTGYLQTISRLVSILAQNVPLSWGPTFFAVSALMIQALPSTLLMSPRMADAWPDPLGRVCFAFIYVLLPNSVEVLTNLTNAQWHLASLAFLIVVIRPSSSRVLNVAELVALAISGLSGPFAIFLLPIAVWQFLESRAAAVLVRVAIVTACVGVQGWMLLETMNAERLHTPLGAGIITLARILSFQIILGASLGIRLLIRFSGSWVWRIDAVPIVITLVSGVLTSVALRRGSSLLRKGLVYAALMLAAALISPVISTTEPQWPQMTLPNAGNRYFLIPMLAWIGVLFTLVRDWGPSRVSAFGFLVLLPVGIMTDFHYRAARPTDFVERAREFGSAPTGTQMEFPVHPPGFQPMVLTKR
jgi:hypothetical protein